jgi:sirohydrochlorin ferrochelatase
MNLLLVAHGTRDPAGAHVTEAVAAQVRRRLPEVTVEVAYADVHGPTIGSALAALPDGPCVAVPMFLAAGYHVRVDVPEQLRAAGRPDVHLAETFGPDPALVAVAVDRLAAAGYRPGDAAVLAVAGSSDPAAGADSAVAARRLGRALGGPVALATIAAGGPPVSAVVTRLRSRGASRVAVASWLLAPGLFQRRLEVCGASVVAAPLGTHPSVAGLVVARYRDVIGAARSA